MIPITTKNMKNEMSTPDMRQYATDLVVLIEKFPFQDALEVGCAWGISTLAFLSTRPDAHLTTVDNDSYPDAYERALEEVTANNFGDRWKFILSDSKDYWQAGGEKNGFFDFIYIDGDHSYDGAHRDMIGAWNHLKLGGIMAMDDVAHKNNRPNDYDQFGVSIAAMEHWYNNPLITEAGFVGKILWFKK